MPVVCSKIHSLEQLFLYTQLGMVSSEERACSNVVLKRRGVFTICSEAWTGSSLARAVSGPGGGNREQDVP